MDTKEAADYLGISVVAVRAAVYKRRLPVATIGGRNGRKAYRFNQDDLDAYRKRWANNHEDGMISIKAISVEYGINQGRVRAALQRNKLVVACNDGRTHLYRREEVQQLAQQERWV